MKNHVLRGILCALFGTALLLSPQVTLAAIAPGEALTLERCLEIALSANPDLVAEEAGARGAE
ncbi:MAG: hypothetical protein PHF19_08885, partial [Synergistales bacterium]|nr:hypothetical protein [Synergistales bacterium]